MPDFEFLPETQSNYNHAYTIEDNVLKLLYLLYFYIYASKTEWVEISIDYATYKIIDPQS